MEDETEDITTHLESASPEYGSTLKAFDCELLTLDDIYVLIGLGPAQFLYWLLTFLLSFSGYAEMIVFSVILPSLRCEWNFNSVFEVSITVSSFASYALFTALFGSVADKYGRKTVIRWSTLVLLLAAIVAAVSPNKWVFLVSRLITGASVGVNMSCIVCYGTEFAESRYRVYGVILFMLSEAVALVTVNGVASTVLETVGWRWLIIFASLPAVIALILILVLPESPRFLCVSGQERKAMHAVMFIARLNGKEIPENVQMKCYEGKNLGSYSMILNDENIMTTIGLSAIYLCNIFIEIGLIVLLPLLFNNHFSVFLPSKMKCRLLSEDDMSKMTLISISSVFGIIAALVFGQIIGRLKPLRLASFLSAILMGSLFLCQCASCDESAMSIIMSFTKLTEFFAVSLVWIIIPESFPTNIRSTATGFINCWGKVGGLLGAMLVYLLYTNVDSYSVFGMFLFVTFLTCAGTMMYDKETKHEVLRDI